MVITEKVMSTVAYKGKDVVNAPFWKDCYRKDEVTAEQLGNGKQWFEYWVKFNGVTPTFITKTKKI